MKKSISYISSLCFYMPGVLKHWPREKIIVAAFYLAPLTPIFAQDATSYYNQGLQNASEGKFAEAIKCFDKTIALKPGYYVAWLDRGRTNLSLGLFKKALADLDHAIKLDPRYQEAWLLRGMVKYNLADYDGALADNTHAIALKPNGTWAYYDRGLANEALGKIDAACTDYKKALQLGLSIAQEKVDMCNNPSKSDNESLNLIQKADSYYRQAYEKERSGDFEEAIKLLDKIIATKENYFFAWVERGYCKSMLKRFKEAIVDFDEVIKLNGRYQEGWFMRGSAKYNLGDYDGALADYSQNIALDPKDAKAYFSRGLTYEALRKKDSACADFQKSLEWGFSEAKNYVDDCNNPNKSNFNDNTVTLDTANGRAILLAQGTIIKTIGTDTTYGILFYVLPPGAGTFDSSIITYHEVLKQNPFASIHVWLKNGTDVNMKVVLTGEDQPETKLSLFIGVFDRTDKEQMLENDVEKITIDSGKTSYEYFIKDNYSDNIKILLGRTVSN